MTVSFLSLWLAGDTVLLWIFFIVKTKLPSTDFFLSFKAHKKQKVVSFWLFIVFIKSDVSIVLHYCSGGLNNLNGSSKYEWVAIQKLCRHFHIFFTPPSLFGRLSIYWFFFTKSRLWHTHLLPDFGQSRLWMTLTVYKKGHLIIFEFLAYRYDRLLWYSGWIEAVFFTNLRQLFNNYW